MRPERRRAALVCVLSAALTLAPAPASAFCRITTIETVTDGADTTACYDTTHPPVWWRSACVGLGVAAGGSAYAPYDVVRGLLFDTVLPRWMNADCPGSTSKRSLHPSIDVVDLGPVACESHQANLYGHNANEVLFHDDAWPYDEGAGCSPADVTIALTTVTFHPETGELWDADIEINTACHPVSTQVPVPADRYDLESILQHETGHFLGLAHPPDPNAIMYYLYSPGSDGKRTLNADDVLGACTIYPPTGERGVDPKVVDGGVVLEGPCDATPRNGFSSACVPDAGNQPPAVAPTTLACSASKRADVPGAVWVVAAPLSLIVARRRRRVRRDRSC